MLIEIEVGDGDVELGWGGRLEVNQEWKEREDVMEGKSYTKTACQSDLRFKSYKFLHNITCERFDGVYGRCKSGINSLLISRWKPSINWQKTLFLMIASTNSTRAAAAKSLFRALSSLKGSVLVARKMNSGRACRSSGRVFSMLSQWRTRTRADGAPSVAVC